MSIFHRPCNLHHRSRVSGLISLPHRQNVSSELGHGKYTLSDAKVLRSLWEICLDFSAAVASCSEALQTDLETSFGPQTCSFPTGVIASIQWECSGSWTVCQFTSGFTQPVQDSLRETKQKHREEMEPLGLTADIFLDHYAYDLLSLGFMNVRVDALKLLSQKTDCN